jgi:hypothetical protein
MKTPIVSASKIINAPAGQIYNLIADYREGHTAILPKSYFSALEVEEGGYGEGTVIRYQMRILGRTRSFRARITEPDPGCTLLETDLNSNISTSFTVWSIGHRNHARVTIMTVLKHHGLVEGFLARIFLTYVYRQELELLARVMKNHEQFSQGVNPNHHVHTTTSK